MLQITRQEKRPDIVISGTLDSKIFKDLHAITCKRLDFDLVGKNCEYPGTFYFRYYLCNAM